MAKHRGKGIAAIEYPTGMNQNGDPSQAWIKVKPDGRIDVFAGTADIGNGSKTIQSQIVAETIGVPYDWITYDNSNTDSSPMCTGTFASRATFVAGKAAEKAALQVKAEAARDRGQGARDRPRRPRDRRRRGDRQGGAADEDVRRGRGRGGDLRSRRAHHRHGRAAQAVRRDHRLGDGSRSTPAPLGDLVRDLRGRGRGGRRDRRGAGSPAPAVLRRRARDQPDAGRGSDRGRGDDGPRARRPRELLPVLPGRREPRRQFGSYLAPGMEEMPQIDTILIENPSADGPYGAKGIGEMANNPQPPAIAAAVYDAVGVWITELPITPERVLRALEAKAEPRARGQEGRVRRGALGERGLERRDAVRGSRLSSPFRTGTAWIATLFPGVAIHAIGGEQVMLCHVTYEPGTTVARHSHPTAEQVMWIVEGDVTMTVGRRDRRARRGRRRRRQSAGSSTSSIRALRLVGSCQGSTRGAPRWPRRRG